jgi:hypothetical protein
VEALGIKSEAGLDVLPALRVTLRPDKRIHVGEETSFLVETNRPGDAVSLNVAFGDGSPNDTAPLRPAIEHVYAQKGKYTVSWTATAARTQATGQIEVIVATAVSLPPWWVVVIGSVALVSTAGLAAHRLGWVRPTLHLKTNVRSVRAIARRVPDLEIEYRLKQYLPGCRVRFVVRPKTSTAETRKTYV